MSWDGLCGSLPSHQDELMASHGGQPSIAEQDQNNGAGLPAVDRGGDDSGNIVSTGT